MIEKFLY